MLAEPQLDFRCSYEQVRLNKDGSIVFQGLFAVKDPYLGFFNDSMMFSLNFRSLKKRVTDPRMDGWTDGQTDPDIEMRGRI